MKLILTAILAIVLFVGCRTTTETVYVDRWRDRDVVRVDSVTVTNTDSVYIVQKGDTVYNTTVRIRYRDKIKIERDTVTKLDVITKTETVTETKYRKGIFYYSGIVFFILLIVYLIVKVAIPRLR
jgi:hypothetical protein